MVESSTNLDLRAVIFETLKAHRTTGESTEVIARDITSAIRRNFHVAGHDVRDALQEARNSLNAFRIGGSVRVDITATIERLDQALSAIPS